MTRVSALRAVRTSMTRASGIGRAGAHHGEILQGVFSADGRLMRALVTLPCPLFVAEVSAVLKPDQRVIEVTPAWKVKARTAARLTLDTLGLPETGARLVVHGAIPVCRGYGSSTSDVVATVRAICSALNAQLDETEVAKLAVRSEIASDPLMFNRAVLFAQRDGVVLEDFHAHFPPLEVLGFSTTDHKTGVSTLEFSPARYSKGDAGKFEELRLHLRDALARGDVGALGLVASESTQLNQRHLPVSGLDELIQIMRSVGASGLQVAHSGDVAGLLFDPKDADVEARLEEAEALLAAAGIAETWRFRSVQVT